MIADQTGETTQELAIVTGGARRLGREIVLGLAKRGYAIGLHYHHSAREALTLAEELESQGTAVLLMQADLRSPAAIRRMFKKVEESGFVLKVLINSAAKMEHKPLMGISTREWDDLFALNLRAVWLCSIQAAKLMKAGGVIINISDVGAQRAWAGFGAYSITKSALNSLTKILAQSLAPDIRVNAVAPGLVMPSEKMSSEDWKKLVNKTPLHRPVDTEAILKMIGFLLDNAYITGEVVNVDGGRHLV